MSTKIDLSGVMLNEYRDENTEMSSNPHEILSILRNSFNNGLTRNLQFRRQQLQQLLRLLDENTEDILNVLYQDLHKSKHETILSEILITKSEIKTMLANMDEWTKPEKPDKPLLNIMHNVIIYKEPYGVVLVIGAWNYPLQLTLIPLIGAIAAGNCCIIKPSELATNTGELLAKLVPKYLNDDCYRVFLGGIQETQELLKLRYDYIFFTGSTRIGKIVQKQAAEYLTPTTLELGGKSPVFVDKNTDLNLVANRIMWGKVLNSGQSCIAPDYILCSKSIQDDFIEACKCVLQKYYQDKIQESPDYGRIINDNHFKRIIKLLDNSKIALGGNYIVEQRFIEPTILVDVKPNDPIMEEEIFGPILPILNVETINEAIDFINKREKPLALYIFSNNQKNIDLIIENTSSGGVCVNDTLMHFSCDSLPFGGVGSSGIGAYHGKATFDTFVHRKGALLTKLNQFGEKLQSSRYPPYTKNKTDFLVTMMSRNTIISLKNVVNFMYFGLGIVTALSMKWLCDYYHKKNL